MATHSQQISSTVNAPASACRSCGGNNLESVLDLGISPLADRMPTQRQLSEHEPSFPLEVVFCRDCALVQVLETVSPEVLFYDEYPYFSSFTDSWLEHCRRNVEELIEKRRLGPDSLVVELASNDGYLLQYYQQAGIPVLGIDPAPGPAAAAEAQGVPTRQAFFTDDYAAQMAAEGLTADVIHANNVLAHVEDTNGFIAGMGRLLAEDGVAVIEHPYVRDLVEHCQFDTMYHEHLCYFSVTALDTLFRRHGLYLQDIRRLPTHGGSLRLYVGKSDTPSANVSRLLEEERRLGMDGIEYYRAFSDRVQQVCKDLRGLLKKLRAQGYRIAGYGAAAKATTLINVAGIDTDLMEYVVDRNIHKQGRFMPGQHQPIREPSALLEDKPDYTVLLVWNLAEEVIAQQQEYLRQGGHFIVPVPEPKVL